MLFYKVNVYKISMARMLLTDEPTNERHINMWISIFSRENIHYRLQVDICVIWQRRGLRKLCKDRQYGKEERYQTFSYLTKLVCRNKQI